MNKNLLRNKIRPLFQFSILGIIFYLLARKILTSGFVVDFEKFCPFGGLLSLGSKLWLGSLSCSMSEVAIFMGIALAVGVMFFGKLFCSYICPIGTVIEWLNKIGDKLKISFTLKGVFDRILRLGKYVLLFFAAYFTITSSELWCKKFDPYYGLVSGFDHDVVLWWSLTAIFIVLIYSIYSATNFLMLHFEFFSYPPKTEPQLFVQRNLIKINESLLYGFYNLHIQNGTFIITSHGYSMYAIQ